jgi:hypothetical protein
MLPLAALVQPRLALSRYSQRAFPFEQSRMRVIKAAVERMRDEIAEVFWLNLRSACISDCASPIVARANASASYSKQRDHM